MKFIKRDARRLSAFVLLVSLQLLAAQTTATAKPPYGEAPATLPPPAAPISATAIPSEAEVLAALKPGIPALRQVYALRDAGKKDEALEALLAYLRAESAQRYYFNWKNFRQRFAEYRKNYPGQQSKHAALADSQMSTYPPETHWILPFENLKGKQVSAYELRHLARQNKSVDMALIYYYDNQRADYLHYWLRQIADLNRAFSEGAYDDAGNGIYENLRAGMRVQNWLFCHHAYLSSTDYDDRSQLLVIKTLLHHGAQLQKRTERYRSGNHHTKGLTALFELAVFCSDFSVAREWQNQAIDGLLQHLQKEINADGFQFERSVHYHIGDIDNYFRVYQLARLNGITLPQIYTEQFRKLFTALAQLAQPNRRLPVLQDDTDAPYSDNNAMDYPMTIGALLFADPVYRYFASNQIAAEIYWRLRPEQMAAFKRMKPAPPRWGSLALPETGYYCMRSGWEKNDLYLTISAGLSAEKPDHQHGDMLGIVAYANGHEILPNYQVKYNDADFAFWKNSWTKSVALVDSLPLGRGWTPNEGGSGFGKWARLPRPRVMEWRTGKPFDYFRGAHDGYDSLGVHYERQVLFVNKSFWIVQDHFSSATPHRYQQVWQGHYDIIGNQQARAVFENKSGLQIIQLNSTTGPVARSRFRNKGNVVFQNTSAKDFVFTTLLYPFQEGEEARLEKGDDEQRLSLRDARIRIAKSGTIDITGADGTLLLQIEANAFIALPQNPRNHGALLHDNFAVAKERCRKMIDRIDLPKKLPRSTGHGGDLKLAPPKDWTSGFFPGCLWFLYEYSGETYWKEEAQKYTVYLEDEKNNDTTHDMGFKMMCSFGNGYRLGGNEEYRDILLHSARTLATRFNPRVGCIRSWDHNRSKWQFPVIIDNMMNLELLFWAFRASGDSGFYRIAVSHANTTLRNHFRADHSTWHVVDYDTLTGAVRNKQTHQGYSDDSAWSRGQAWGLYGYTLCFRESGDRRYLSQAQKIADFILDHKNMPADGIPFWDYDAPRIPDEPRDASAGAILCSALYDLSGFLGQDGEKYAAKADVILASLSSAKYRAQTGEAGYFILKHGSGDIPHQIEIDVPLIYADYYFLEANLRKMKRR